MARVNGMRRYAWGDRKVTQGLTEVYQDFMLEHVSGGWSFVCFDNHTFSVWLIYGYLGATTPCYLPFEFRKMKIKIADYRIYNAKQTGYAAIRHDIATGVLNV